VIGRLTGRVVEEAPDGILVVDVGGVGYEVAAPLGTAGRAMANDPSGGITLFVHTHVREDALLLYGFSTREDRAAFRALIAVSNIGPKIAMAILGVLSAAELALVVGRGEAGRLKAIPGVGKKTAERIILELKDKLSASVEQGVVKLMPKPAAKDGKSELLLGALTGMGFRPGEAERVVASLAPRFESSPLDDLVRDALAVLAR
jgi:Holliday junction DNA helicase RuvA